MSLVGKRTRWIVALGGLNWGTLTLTIKNLHVSQIGLVNYRHDISSSLSKIGQKTNCILPNPNVICILVIIKEQL